MVSIGLWLAACVVVLTAFTVTHLALFAAVARDPAVPVTERWLALLPPALPIVAFRAGKRGGVVLWGLLAAGYTVLRMLG